MFTCFGKCVILFYFHCMQSKIKRQKLVLASILLIAAFTYPVIAIASRPVLIGGVPLLYLYVLGVWIIAIMIFFSIANTKQRRPDE